MRKPDHIWPDEYESWNWPQPMTDAERLAYAVEAAESTRRISAKAEAKRAEHEAAAQAASDPEVAKRERKLARNAKWEQESLAESRDYFEHYITNAARKR